MSNQIEAAATAAVTSFRDADRHDKPTIRKTLRLQAVIEATGFTRQTIWQKVRDKTFPAPVELSGNSIGWYEDEVALWQERLPRRTYRADAAA